MQIANVVLENKSWPPTLLLATATREPHIVKFANAIAWSHFVHRILSAFSYEISVSQNATTVKSIVDYIFCLLSTKMTYETSRLASVRFLHLISSFM